jgi:hypothetical protein
MIRTQIQLHAEQVKWLKSYALEKNISMSQAIRNSVDHYVLYVENVRKRRSKKKRALKAVGSFSTQNNQNLTKTS